MGGGCGNWPFFKVVGRPSWRNWGSMECANDVNGPSSMTTVWVASLPDLAKSGSLYFWNHLYPIITSDYLKAIAWISSSLRWSPTGSTDYLSLQPTSKQLSNPECFLLPHIMAKRKEIYTESTSRVEGLGDFHKIMQMTHAETSSWVELVKSKPTWPRSFLLTLWRLSRYSVSGVWPRASPITLFLPKKNLQWKPKENKN